MTTTQISMASGTDTSYIRNKFVW